MYFSKIPVARPRKKYSTVFGSGGNITWAGGSPYGVFGFVSRSGAMIMISPLRSSYTGLSSYRTPRM